MKFGKTEIHVTKLLQVKKEYKPNKALFVSQIPKM